MGGDPNTGTGGDAASIATGDTGERGDTEVNAQRANARDRRTVDPAEALGVPGGGEKPANRPAVLRPPR